MRSLLFVLAFAFFPLNAAAQNMPWIVIPDSITTVPDGGVPTDLPWSLITQEREVVFDSIGGSGAAMGSTRLGSYNSSAIPTTMDRICGYFSQCEGVVLQAGVNDYFLATTWADHRTSILRVLDWADARNKRVLMLDLVYNRTAELGAPTNAAGLTFASIRNARFLECAARAPRCVFALRPANLNVLTPGFYQPDGTHLTPAGRRAYTDWVESVAAANSLF